MSTNPTTVDSLLAQVERSLAELHVGPTFDSLLAEFHFDCTDRSRPPSGMTTTRGPQYAAIENSSVPEHVALYSQWQELLMRRKPVLWHMLRTLEDTGFWTPEIVAKSQWSRGVGLSSASGKRMIQLRRGPSPMVIVADRTHGGTVTGYSAVWSNAGGQLQIRRPGRDTVLFKAIAHKDYGELGDYPFGRELISQFENEVEQLEATTDEIRDVPRWFDPSSPNVQGISRGTFN